MDGWARISSRQNPLVKQICSLNDKKNRAKSRLFRFDGVKLLGEALNTGVEIEWIVLSENASTLAIKLAKDAIRDGRVEPLQVVEVTGSVFEKLSEERSPEGVITVARYLSELHREFTNEFPQRSERLLIAESLRDPGNLGTVMRSCFALGIDTLALSDDCADIYNPKTLRAAMGATFRQKTLTLKRESMKEFIVMLRESGRSVYAAALGDDSMDMTKLALSDGDCFVIGNEGHGLSQETVDACTSSVIIPMREGAESLNASAAAAICIWETVKVPQKSQDN